MGGFWTRPFLRTSGTIFSARRIERRTVLWPFPVSLASFSVAETALNLSVVFFFPLPGPPRFVTVRDLPVAQLRRVRMLQCRLDGPAPTIRQTPHRRYRSP